MTSMAHQIAVHNLLIEIADKKNKQKDIAIKYKQAFGIIPTSKWGEINNTIVERWSMSGLIRVKKMAWKL